MSEYYIAYEADLRCYPNYSFEIGDVDGDGRAELVCLNQNGTRSRLPFWSASTRTATGSGR